MVICGRYRRFSLNCKQKPEVIQYKSCLLYTTVELVMKVRLPKRKLLINYCLNFHKYLNTLKSVPTNKKIKMGTSKEERQNYKLKGIYLMLKKCKILWTVFPFQRNPSHSSALILEVCRLHWFCYLNLCIICKWTQLQVLACQDFHLHTMLT